MDAEHQQPHPPGVDREQDAHFLIRVDTALDRHRKNSEPPPPNVHETVIHTQAPTPDAGVGPPSSAPAGEAKYDTLPRPLGIGSATAPQFFGAGGPMCVALFLIQIVSDLSVPGPTRMRRFDETTLQSRKASRPSSPPPAIVGIGNKGTWPRPCRRSTLLELASWEPHSVRTVARPDYTEEKIVLAMVSSVAPKNSDYVPIDPPFHSRSACQRGARAISVINSHATSRQADRRFLRVSTYLLRHWQWLEYDVKVSSCL